MPVFVKRLIAVTLLCLLNGCVGLDVVKVEKLKRGEPSLAASSTKKVTYGDGYKWNGIIISAILPIPLMVPSGRVATTEWIKDGKVVLSEEEKTTAEGIFSCIFLVFCHTNDGSWGQIIFNGAHML